MNLIINGFHNVPQVAVLNRLVKNNNFGYVHHIASDGATIAEKPGTLIETSLYYVIGDGHYDFSDCPPLDGEIIEKMRPYEATALQMMDRLELFSNKGYRRYQKRHDLYLKHLRYWHHITTSRKITLFISQNIPHEIYDYIIYAICQIKSIPVLFFFQIQVHDATLALSDISGWQREILPEYERLQQLQATTAIAALALTGNAAREWSLRANRQAPHYMTRSWYGFKDTNTFLNMRRLKNKNRLKKILNPVTLAKYVVFLIRKNIQKKILFFSYSSLTTPPDYSKPYVYFPLHLQPESTTCPMGGALGDQTLVAEIIARSLPDGVFLYIKENPKQTYLCRDYRFYRNLSQLSDKIVFVPLKTDTYQLIKNSVAVATVTGTAGWEAFFEKKPVLVFGQCFYDSAPGAFKVRSQSDCQRVLKAIVNNEFRYDEKKLKLFLQAVSNVALNACLDADYYGVSSLSIEESNERLYNFLEKYLIKFSSPASL